MSPDLPAPPPPVVRDAPAEVAPAARTLDPRLALAELGVRLDGPTAGTSSVSARDFVARGIAPVYRGDGVRLAVNAGYGVTQLDTEDATTADERALHRFDLGLNGSVKLSEHLDLRGGANGTYASDLRGETASALQGTFTGMVRWAASDRNAFFFGAVVTTQTTLFSPVLPVLGLVHQTPGSPFRIEILLPRGVLGSYDFDDRFRGIVALEAEGKAWAVERADGSYGRLTRRQGGRGYVGMQARLFGPVRLEARGGASMFSYELEASASTAGAASNRDVDIALRPAAYAQLGLVVMP